jgi:hypothetical protein
VLTEFGAVEFASRATFHGVLHETIRSADRTHSTLTGVSFDAAEVFSAFEQWLESVTTGRPVFVSDNPAFDFQWINHGFHHALGRNPFGHSGRRISDFYAGLMGDFGKTQAWKRFRVTKHDHNPVNDAMGNAEAFERLLKGER